MDSQSHSYLGNLLGYIVQHYSVMSLVGSLWSNGESYSGERSVFMVMTGMLGGGRNIYKNALSLASKFSDVLCRIYCMHALWAVANVITQGTFLQEQNNEKI